jgi:hypothetical protein
MHRTRIVPLLLTSGLLAILSASAFGQTYCFPPAVGVPGWSGAPNNIRDPRWNGALATTPVDLASPDPFEFRGLTVDEAGRKNIVITWRADVDPGAEWTSAPSYLADDMYAYFVTGDGTPANPYAGNMIRIANRAAHCSTNCSAHCGALMVKIFRYDAAGSTWIPVASYDPLYDPLPPANVPAWLVDNATYDLECVDTAGTVTCDAWTVTLKVPLSSTATPEDPSTGLNLPTTATFRFGQDLRVNSQAGPATWTPQTPFTWPTTTPASDDDGGYYRPVSGLATVKLGSGTGCASGVFIDAGKISVNGSNQINPTSANVFLANPTNGLSSTALGSQSLKGTFRIADWGAAFVGATPSWRDIPGCGNVVSSAPAANVAGGADFSVTCSWTPDHRDQCRFGRALATASDPHACDDVPTSEDRNIHQCVLLEMKKNEGATLPADFFFSRRSAYRNMDFVHASEMVRSARLELLPQPLVRGRPVPPKTRDMYVYVRTTGMPAKVVAPLAKQVARPEVTKTVRDAKLVSKLSALGVQNGVIGKEVAAVLKEQVKLGKLTHREVAAILPTYVAYVWQDTGKTTRVKGKKVKVFQSAPSFGYYASHDGPLVGWRYGLVGRSVKPLAPNFYKITVPAKGRLDVTTWLRACEDDACLQKAPPRR